MQYTEETPYESEARLTALEQQQALIQARQNLAQTVVRYARGIDEQRDEDFAALFTEDVVLQTQPWTQRPLVWKISRMLITLDYMTTLERGWGMLAERVLPFPPRQPI